MISFRFSDLCKGVTFANFHIFKTLPIEKLLYIMWHKTGSIFIYNLFQETNQKSVRTDSFLESILIIISMTSSVETHESENVLSVSESTFNDSSVGSISFVNSIGVLIECWLKSEAFISTEEKLLGIDFSQRFFFGIKVFKTFHFSICCFCWSNIFAIDVLLAFLIVFKNLFLCCLY